MKISHSHGVIDSAMVSHERGLWAVKWSFFGLFATALFQAVIVGMSNSVALLADTIHNFGDAVTAIPLGAAFLFARLKPSKKFTYGYGRVEDLAGVAVVLLILFIVWDSGKSVFTRMLDGVEPGVIKEIHHAVQEVDGVKEIGEIRAR